MGLGSNDLALGDAVTAAHAQNVLYCVGSDFMEVKQLATTLIRQLPASSMGLQVHLSIFLQKDFLGHGCQTTEGHISILIALKGPHLVKKTPWVYYSSL